MSPRAQAALARISYLSHPTATFEIELLQDVRALRDGCLNPDGCLDLVHLATDLGHLGYACHVQRNDPVDLMHGGHLSGVLAFGTDKTCLEKLRHEFLVCTGRSDGSLQHHCLIDPQFRDQFAIGQPTDQYLVIWEAVPEEFVGSALRLQSLVNALSTEVALVYEEQGLPLPPWRKSHAVLGRWFDVDSAVFKLQQLKKRQQLLALQQQRAAAGGATYHDGSPMGDASSEERQKASPDTGVQDVSMLRHGTRSATMAVAAAASDDPIGGSAQFHASLAMHKEALRIQRERRGRKGTVDTQKIIDALSEPSNKPHRRRALEQSLQRETTAHEGSSADLACATDGRHGAAVVEREIDKEDMYESQGNREQQYDRMHSGIDSRTVQDRGGVAVVAEGGEGAGDGGDDSSQHQGAHHLWESGIRPVTSWGDLATIMEAPSSSNGASSSSGLSSYTSGHGSATDVGARARANAARSAAHNVNVPTRIIVESEEMVELSTSASGTKHTTLGRSRSSSSSSSRRVSMLARRLRNLAS